MQEQLTEIYCLYKDEYIMEIREHVMCTEMTQWRNFLVQLERMTEEYYVQEKMSVHAIILMFLLNIQNHCLFHQVCNAIVQLWIKRINLHVLKRFNQMKMIETQIYDICDKIIF